MKIDSLIIALALSIIAGFQVLHAQDTLKKDISIMVTGNIIQETDTNTGATTSRPITIKNVLSVLGITGTAKDLRYYHDDTTNSIVIAPKTLTVSGSGTPTATVFHYVNSTYVDWNPTRSSYITGTDVSGLNGDLLGTAIEREVYPSDIQTNRTEFYVFGTIAGLPTIMTGNVVRIFKR